MIIQETLKFIEGLEINKENELIDFLIENKYPQSFIDVVEDGFIKELLTIEELYDILKVIK